MALLTVGVACLLAAGAHAAELTNQLQASNHWAFIPPTRSAVPEVRNARWIRNPIDAFVLARLEREGLRPSPEADRRTLIRRLSLDLLGLPPTPDEVDTFIRDHRSDAYEQLVDRLIASPHYGERWGRHWLDLARYADSDGYEKDSVRPYAYFYRDWVIKALNADMPFDRFTTEQLAGDLLPDAGLEQKIATGFHRNTLKNFEGGVDQEEFRCKAVVDRVSTTGTVWLGLTVGCAECHSHKYDPISQREFYQLFAFFNDSDDVDVPVAEASELAVFENLRSAWAAENNSLKAELDRLQSSGAGAGEDQKKAIERLKEKVAAAAKREPKPPPQKAQTLARAAKPRTTAVHIRGDFLRRGDEVQPATPAVLHALKPRSASEADRLDFAQWLFDPGNPLTSRVSVNRIWGHLFGRAFVTTTDDFGKRGEKPSHPELLDWLATEFPRLGWSQKAIIRLIVTSATYRQSSAWRAELAARDSNNVLLARQNRFRLEAESVRDTFLSASGLLDRKMGGPSIRPPLPADIAALGYANSIKWNESPGKDRYRRGLYVFFQRTVPYPMLMAFDAPDSNVTCTRRERSNTPLQALTLLNDSVFVECAQALGRELATRSNSAPRQKIRSAFVQCLTREPSRDELARLEELFSAQVEFVSADPGKAELIAGALDGTDSQTRIEAAGLIMVARTIMNLDEFVTRE